MISMNLPSIVLHPGRCAMTADMQALPARQRETAAEQAEQIWAERNRRVAALTLRLAAERTHSPSDRIGDSLAACLIREQIPVSTDADYPNWTPGGAS